jgi:hypothetical protein
MISFAGFLSSALVALEPDPAVSLCMTLVNAHSVADVRAKKGKALNAIE